MQVQIEHKEGALSGVALKGLSYPERGVLLLHPHPLYGGDMESPVIRGLEAMLSETGFTTLRFNFLGVDSNDGTYSGPNGAIEDAYAAALFMKNTLSVDRLGLIGYSFGGSIALGLASKIEKDFVVTMSAFLKLLSETSVKITCLESLDCELLLVHGTKDRVVPYNDMEAIADRTRTPTRKLPIQDEGHFYHTSLNSVILQIREFVNSVWKK